jgi:hypothetical protein
MVIIVVISLQGRFIPAIFVSLVAIGGLDYFFIAPVFRIMMAGPLDLAALVAYLTTAIVITSLLARLRRSVRELRLSEARLAEGERLSRTGAGHGTFPSARTPIGRPDTFESLDSSPRRSQSLTKRRCNGSIRMILLCSKNVLAKRSAKRRRGITASGLRSQASRQSMFARLAGQCWTNPGIWSSTLEP